MSPLQDAAGRASTPTSEGLVVTHLGRGEQLKALGIATLGGMLEYFEFVVYFYLAPQISQNFFSAEAPEWLRLVQTFAILAAGYLMRPIGGIVLASFGDKLGRKRMFALTLFLMAGPTLAIGCLPTYAQIGIFAPLLLLLCRMLQGLSVGGELPGAVSFVSEHVPVRHLGLACGILTASLSSGALLGSLVVNLTTQRLGSEAMFDYGWRIPFALGGVFGLISVYLRRFASETPVFEAMKARRTTAVHRPIRALLTSHRVELFACMAIASLTAALTALATQYPITFFVAQKGLPMPVVLQAHTALMLALMAGHITTGWIADRTNLLAVFTLTALGAIASLVWMYGYADSDALWRPFVAVGFCGGAMGLGLNLMARAYAPQVRFTGIATSYNIPLAVIGGALPIVLTLVTRVNPLWAAALGAFFCVVGIIGAQVLWPLRKATDRID